MNLLNKAKYYRVILFTLLIITLVSPSTAETITGSPAELINGSGSFSWTSQNFRDRSKVFDFKGFFIK